MLTYSRHMKANSVTELQRLTSGPFHSSAKPMRERLGVEITGETSAYFLSCYLDKVRRGSSQHSQFPALHRLHSPEKPTQCNQRFHGYHC